MLYICTVTGSGVAVRAVDLLNDDRDFGGPEVQAAVGFEVQRRKLAVHGRRLDELIGAAPCRIDLAVVLRAGSARTAPRTSS